MTPRDIIAAWSARILAAPERVREIGAAYKFVITGKDGGTWVFNCKDPVSVVEEDGNAECTVTLSADAFQEIVKGKLNPQAAFLQGRMKVSGNMLLALKLSELMDNLISGKSSIPV